MTPLQMQKLEIRMQKLEEHLAALRWEGHLLHDEITATEMETIETQKRLDAGRDRFSRLEALAHAGATNAEIGAELDIPSGTVSELLKRCGIVRVYGQRGSRYRSPERKTYPLLDDETWLKERYCVDEMTGEEIAALLGCGPSVIYRRLKKLSVPRRKRGPRRRDDGRGSEGVELPDQPEAD